MPKIRLRSQRRKSREKLFYPQLLDNRPGPWVVHESVLDHAAVDLGGQQAWVPPALTSAQEKARLHEAYHVKVSPRDWLKVTLGIVSEGLSQGIMVSTETVLTIVKMMEENRVDWLLWSRHRHDIRSCRDALDWSKMTIPEDDPVEATAWVLQLAWTVWASEGFGKDKVPNPPPPREPDPEAKLFFNACWKIVQEYNSDLAMCIIKACLTMYNKPTAETRDAGTLQIVTYFPIKDPLELPPEKQEEREKQEEKKSEQKKSDDDVDEDESGGVKNDWSVIKGGIQYHDHTKGRRRPTVAIHKGYVPTDFGFKVRYPHRYAIDGSIFSTQRLSEGSLMLDFSGSMQWDNTDLLDTLEKMPNIYIAGYTGVHDHRYYGRICVIAENGRFNLFSGIDPECNGENDIDLEALEVLATKPGPRFWLSDGMVTGGKHMFRIPLTDAGPLTPMLKKPLLSLRSTAIAYLGHCSVLIHKVNVLMKRAEIYRVPNAATMRDLVRGKRVTLYRTCTPENTTHRSRWYDDAIDTSPVRFQL